MACNCASQQQIEKIFKEYGEEKNKLNASLEMGARFKKKLIDSTVNCVVFLVSPIIIGYILYKGTFGNNKISLAKFFGLRKYAK